MKSYQVTITDLPLITNELIVEVTMIDDFDDYLRKNGLSEEDGVILSVIEALVDSLQNEFCTFKVERKSNV